jgi:uncharacterized protein
MKINFSGIQNKTSVMEFNTDTRELDISDNDLRAASGIHIVCTISRYTDLSRVEIRVTARISQNCSLCVESFEQDITGEISLIVRHLKKGELIPSYTEEETEDFESVDENLIFLPFGEDTIDITENVHDTLLLAVPTKPVCADGCKGLCPACGTNLNTGVCGCSNERIDSRWQALSKLAEKPTENTKSE